MCRAYFDESSDDVNTFLMAGWVADVIEWEKFSPAWYTELANAPSIRYFKHNEAMGLKGEFAGWQAAKRDEKILSLAQVIARHEVSGIIGAISLPQFKTLFDASILPKRALRGIITFTEPYHFACQTIIAGTLGFQIMEAKNLSDRVDFVFDEGVKFLAESAEFFPQTMEKLPAEAHAIMGAVSSANDKRVPELQAADLLAGQALKKLRGGEESAVHTTLGRKKILPFNCLPKYPGNIPKTVRMLNMVWATMRLDKATKSGSNK
jgi:hypothetical protein